MRAAACLGEDLLGALACAPRHGTEYVVLVDPGVPELEVAHPRVLSHALSVRLDDAPGGGFAVGLVEADEAPAYDGARDQALEVPFPRAGIRLVEIVDAEDEVALRRGERAEVRHVHVAAGLHRESGDRRRRDVADHDRRGAPQKRERRRQHAGMADRQQLRQASFCLRFEDCDRVAARWGLVFRMGGERDLASQALAGSEALLDGRSFGER